MFVCSALLYRLIAPKGQRPPARYGAHLGAGFYEPDQLNDLYWADQSAIDPADVTAVSYVPLRDADMRNLADKAFSVQFVFRLRAWLKNRGLKDRFTNCDVVLAPGGGAAVADIWRTLRSLRFLPGCGGDLTAWSRFWLLQFATRVEIRARYFASQGFLVYFDNAVINDEAAVDAQAMRLAGGVRASTQNCHYDGCFVSVEPACDLFFTWGAAHTAHPLMRSTKALNKIVSVGHGLDYLRGLRQEEAAGVREQNVGTFLVAYIDQGIALDAWANPSRHLAVWSVFIALLDEYPSLGIIWKPKRNHVTDWLLEKIDDLSELVAARRVTILKTLPHGRKISPLTGAFATDLVVANGVTSSGFECAFNGRPVVFFDPSHSSRAFIPADDAVDAVCFDADKLKSLVGSLIDGRRKSSDVGLRDGFLHTVDPWRDGRAAARTGNVMISVFNALKDNDIDTALDKVEQEYIENLDQSPSVTSSRVSLNN